MNNKTHMERLVALARSKPATILALALILLGALGVRLWKLDSVPGVFFHDECDNTVNAIEILQGKGPGIFGLDWKPQPALAVHLIALSLKLTGPGVSAIRLPSVIFSVLTLGLFYFLAKQTCGRFAGLLATVLLGFDTVYLHFSRSGWENVQVCFYALLAMTTVRLAEVSGRLFWWGVAGAAAGLGALIYFSGRVIIVFVLLYALGLLAGKYDRKRIACSIAVLLLSFVLVVAPIWGTLWEQWPRFNQRTQAVLITSHLPEGAGWLDVARAMVDNAKRSAQAPFRGSVNNQPRYAPPGRPLFNWVVNVVLIVGIVSSLFFRRSTAMWWSALLVPFFLTQVITAGAPNPARGIGLLPIAYLFIAFGLKTLASAYARRRGLSALILAGIVAYSAYGSLRDYFNWAASPLLSKALQPAVELAEFEEWWDFQNAFINESRGFFNVGMWLARDADPTAVSQSGVPELAHSPAEETASSQVQEVSGTIYRGSTSGQPYEIDLGEFRLEGRRLRVTVSAVSGSDCVYDYLEIIGADGRRLRIEAEDPTYTRGDRPVSQHLVDHHWWLQDYGPFSGHRGLVALRSERPPPLVTLVQLEPGTYRLRLGSFTGDPNNGVFAVRVLFDDGE